MRMGHDMESEVEHTPGAGTFAGVMRLLRRLHADERGAEGLEKLLIIAAIVIPLLGLLLVFRNSITEWVTGGWEDIRGEADDYDPSVP